MKRLRLIVFIFGLVLALVFPLLHIMSYWIGVELMTDRFYTDALLVFLGAVYLLTREKDNNSKEKASDDKNI